MADVPTLQINAPGVPPLIRGISIQLPALVFSDIFTGFGSQGAPQWGVFLGGQPVVVFDTFLGIDFRKGWSICDYPVERGNFETYNKVELPYDARVRFATGGTLEERAALIASCQAIAGTLQLYDVVTPEAVYTSSNVAHIDYSRAQNNGAHLIIFDVLMRQVRVTAQGQASQTGQSTPTDAAATDASAASPFESGAPPLNNTFDPSGASSIPGGLVQPQIPSAGEQSAFDAGVAANSAGSGGGGGGF